MTSADGSFKMSLLTDNVLGICCQKSHLLSLQSSESSDIRSEASGE